MERKDLLSIAIEIFPELNAKGFFTVVQGVEYYYSGLQKMEVETFYKSFYEEYDVAFRVLCTYSVCDCRQNNRWKRLGGTFHDYKTPVLSVVRRMEIPSSPAGIVSRMNNYYNANTLVIEKYSSVELPFETFKNYLSEHGIYLVIRNEKHSLASLNASANNKKGNSRHAQPNSIISKPSLYEAGADFTLPQLCAEGQSLNL